MSMVRVLFVCMGNICRSPTAEGVFRRMVEDAGLSDRIEARSAGTGAWHAGEGADPRSTKAAKRRGYDLSAHSARRVEAEDFARFDYVLAMDRDNLRQLEALAARAPAPAGKKALPRLFLGFAPAVQFEEVPDPYARSADGFEIVLDMIETASEALLEHIRERDLKGSGTFI